MNDTQLLQEIGPTIQSAYEHHMAQAHRHGRPFDPVEVLARASGTDPDPLSYGAVARESFRKHVEGFGEAYGIDVQPVLAASFLVNLLTEDNLPHYTSTIQSTVNQNPGLMAFANEWTAEEDAHGVIMRDYALLTGMIGRDDMAVISGQDYQRGRVSQLRNGTEIAPTNLFEAFSYLTLQEHLTKEAHNKLRWLLDTVGIKVMSPISGDEQNHYEFYRSLNHASLESSADDTLTNMEHVYRTFEMPGKIGIPKFEELALIIGVAGIFDLETVAQSKKTIIDKLPIEDAEPSTDQGKRAQESLLKMADDRTVARHRRLMERLRDNQLAAGQSTDLLPFILGRTIDFRAIETPVGQRITGLQAIAA